MSEHQESHVPVQSFLIAMSFVSLIEFFSHLDTTPGEASSDARLALLVVLLIFHCKSLLYSVELFRGLRLETAGSVRSRRPNFHQILYYMLSAYLPVAFVLWISYHGTFFM